MTGFRRKAGNLMPPEFAPDGCENRADVMFLPVFFMPCRNVFNGKGGDCVKCLWRRKKGEGDPVLPAV
ncbi:hypothetical protein DMI79_12340 [Akkermansia muciniphila]|nr:hypothetical protein DMI79_12340 [Akkermansia muciniphila]